MLRLLQSYSLWTGRTYDCSFLLKRLGIIEVQIYDKEFASKPNVSLKLDLRTSDALLALCNYCVHTDEDNKALRSLAALFVSAADWAVNPNVDMHKILDRMIFAMFSATSRLSEIDKVKVANIVFTTILGWIGQLDDNLVYDPIHLRKCVSGTIDGIATNMTTLYDCQKIVLLDNLCEVLGDGVLDIRVLIADAPADFRLEDVVREHFDSTLTSLKIINTIVSEPSEPTIERLRTLSVDYTQSLCAYLINAVSHEPFLCSILEKTISLYPRLGLMKTESDSILAILRSFKYFQSYANFSALFPTVIEVLVASTEDSPESAYIYIGAVKSVLYALSIRGEIVDYPNISKTMRDGGVALGKFIGPLLEIDRVFCESFASNLVVEFPVTSRSKNLNEESESIGALAEVLGNVAISAKDEAIGKICLSSLLTQFNKLSPENTREREYFLAQFANIGSVCTGAIFNAVIDTLTALLKAGAHPLSTLSCLCNLAKSIGLDPIKRDVLLITLMRYFIETSVSMIGCQKGQDQVDNLTSLLEAICSSLSTYPPFELTNKVTYVDIFQEFWMILILFGYIPKLDWRPEWSKFVPIISQSSPVLIKSRDRLQSPGTTFSQVVLGQPVTPNLRAHLGTYLSNAGTAALRNLNFAQCLWLLAIFYAEKGKLQAGFVDHVGQYVKSEVVELLGLDSLVNDLLSTLISRWSIGQPEAFAKLARVLMNLLCHIQLRTHQSALKLLQQHFINDITVYSDREVWQIIINKLEKMYIVCRAEIGSSSLDEFPAELTRDPTAAQSAFQDLLLLCRKIFGKGAQECPYYFFKFAYTKLYGSSSISHGGRDVALLELFRLLLPNNNNNDERKLSESYLSFNSLLYRNAEGFMHQEVSNVTVDEQGFAYIVDLLCQNCPIQVKKGIKSWLTLLERNSLLSVRIVVTLTLILPMKIREFFTRREHLLRSKLSASPSKTINDQSEANYTVAKAILFDFLSEQMQYDRIRNQQLFPMYLSLVDSLISAPLELLPRFIKLRIYLFAFRIIYSSPSTNTFVEAVRQRLYSSMLYSLSIQPFFMESPAICRWEELDIIRDLNDFLIKEHKKEGKRRAGYLASAFATLLHGHLVNTLVWMNSEVSEKPPNVIDSKKDFISEIIEISLPLTMKILMLSRFSEVSPSIVKWKLVSNQLVESSELVSFTLDRQYPVHIDAWIYCAPLLLPTALNAIRVTVSKKNILVLNLALRSLEEVSPSALYFYIPQLVQTLRYDKLGFSERAILHIAKVSTFFAHQVIWNMRANTYLDEAATMADPIKPHLDQICLQIRQQFNPEAAEFFEREFNFFEKVTSISGALKPYVKKEKWEKKAKIDEELAKIKVDPGVYLPSSPEFIVIDIDYDSGRPLQSHAKAPFLATFKVRCEDSPPCWQSSIFKVGDDCRQDVLALQLISLTKTLLELHSLPLYLFPYRVIATAPGCGVIEVIPKSISRDQLGREKINSLYDYFVFRFGGESSKDFHDARLNFVRSMAAYSVVCYLLAIKDRHNGNIMIDDAGHIIHIDFGFILDIAPGGITFENAPFKLTSEMLQVMGGKDESPYFRWFRELCVQAFLILRTYASAFIQLVECMSDSGLPCFKGERTIRNLRNRFRLDLDSEGARNLMYDLVYKSCENVRTVMYDRFQLSQNGIPY